MNRGSGIVAADNRIGSSEGVTAGADLHGMPIAQSFIFVESSPAGAPFPEAFSGQQS